MRVTDAAPMKKGWGSIWQSGLEDMGFIAAVGQPRMVVSMNGFLSSIVSPQMVFNLRDDGKDVLRDQVLFSTIQGIVCALSNGINVVLHSLRGVDRSTYINVAVHMRVLQVPLEKAMEYVQLAHPAARLEGPYEAQLVRMEHSLIS